MLVNKLVTRSGIDCTGLQPFLLNSNIMSDFHAMTPEQVHRDHYIATGSDTIEAAPFELFSIEVENHNDSLATDGLGGVKCIIAHERAPGDYLIILHMLEYSSGAEHVMWLEPDNEPAYSFNLAVINRLLSVIHDSARAQVRMPGKGRYKDSSGRKKEFRPTETVYIYPSKMTHLTHTDSGRPIKPMTKHWVRAHWRRLNNPESMGKNRKGERIVKGWTWVTHHTKGDKGEAKAKTHKVRK